MDAKPGFSLGLVHSDKAARFSLMDAQPDSVPAKGLQTLHTRTHILLHTHIQSLTHAHTHFTTHTPHTHVLLTRKGLHTHTHTTHTHTHAHTHTHTRIARAAVAEAARLFFIQKIIIYQGKFIVY
jgi:hypothetical protein